MIKTDYVFHASEEARELERLQMLERIFDPGTHRRMLATGLTTGWHCLEVGAGAGSIVRWLEQRASPSGTTAENQSERSFEIPARSLAA